MVYWRNTKRPVWLEQEWQRVMREAGVGNSNSNSNSRKDIEWARAYRP